MTAQTNHEARVRVSFQNAIGSVLYVKTVPEGRAADVALEMIRAAARLRTGDCIRVERAQ